MKRSTLRFFLMTFLLISLMGPYTIAHAASLSVNTLADTIAVDGFCSLREALQNANNNAATHIDCAAGSGADSITFDLSGVITLTSGLPAISDSAGLTLDGSGQTVTISGNHLYRILAVNSGLVTLNNLTFANGSSSTSSGAIDNHSTLTITNCVFSGNSNTQYDGGAIYNQSNTLTIVDTTFNANTAANGSYGGGGIYSLAGSVTITDSVFSANTASHGAGVSCYDCTLNVSGSTFSGNTAPNGSGAGIYNVYGAVTISGSSFTGNGAAWGEGGGSIYSRGGIGSLTIADSIFSGNSATGSPGGAIFSESPLYISMSTFTTNSAGTGGAVFNDANNSTIANCTFSGNTASASGVNGGGLLNSGTLILTNSTIAGNSAVDSGGGIGSLEGTFTLRNTIVAHNSGGNCAGVITNGGNNLDSGITCGWGTLFGSISSADPLLGGLSGAPAYFPLNSGSPALDKGDDSICAAWPVNNQSQNGVVRPQGAHCDMGSYEAASMISHPVYLPVVVR